MVCNSYSILITKGIGPDENKHKNITTHFFHALSFSLWVIWPLHPIPSKVLVKRSTRSRTGFFVANRDPYDEER